MLHTLDDQRKLLVDIRRNMEWVPRLRYSDPYCRRRFSIQCGQMMSPLFFLYSKKDTELLLRYVGVNTCERTITQISG